MNLSKNLTLAEATATKTGLPNVPNQEQIAALRLVAEKVFQPLRDAIGVPIAVTSGFRSAKVNKAVGGSPTSSHTKGEALDLDAHVHGGTTNKAIFDYIRKNLIFDQIIWEFGTEDEPAWVHVSYRVTGNRKQVVRATRVGGKTKYTRM